MLEIKLVASLEEAKEECGLVKKVMNIPKLLSHD